MGTDLRQYIGRLIEVDLRLAKYLDGQMVEEIIKFSGQLAGVTSNGIIVKNNDVVIQAPHTAISAVRPKQVVLQDIRPDCRCVSNG